MSSLSAAAVLRIWEDGQSRHPVDRALALLSLNAPDTPRREFAALSIGRRDELLLDVRERLFGRELNVYAECPGCQEPMELQLETGDVRANVETRENDEVLRREWGNLSVEFRLPDSFDLAAALSTGTENEAYRTLLRRCVTKAKRSKTEADSHSQEVSVDELTDFEQGLAAAAMAEADPQAEILLNLQCPVCEREFQQLLDVADFLWAELSSRAKELLYEVHSLARYYGWSEAEILRMSVRRRRSYMAMLGA